MRKFAGLKIGTGDNEKVLIDEFGTPTKEGILAALLGILSVFGGLVLVKDILSFKISRSVRKRKKQARKVKQARVEVQNQVLKQQAKDQAAELKKLAGMNKTLTKEQEKLKEELKKASDDSSSDAAALAKKLINAVIR